MTMTDFKPMPLSSLEDRLGSALGIAIAMIRYPYTVDSKVMAQIETTFKEWLDG